MIEPLQVLYQVQEGRVPAAWCVLRPCNYVKPPVAVFLGIWCAVMTLLFGAPVFGSIFAPTLIRSGGAGPFVLPAVIPACVVSTMVGYLATVLFAKYGKYEGDALLVLLPEGVVSCEQCSNEAKRVFRVLKYADVMYMKQGIDYGANSVVLSVQYKYGMRGKWSISNKYPSSEWIAQRILKEYTLYALSRELEERRG